MGWLNAAWSLAGHHVVAFVGWLAQRPPLKPHRHEVAEVLLVDVELLLRPESHRQHKVKRGPITRSTPTFAWETARGRGYVWGLRADLLLELLLWIQDKPDKAGARRLAHLEQIRAASS